MKIRSGFVSNSSSSSYIVTFTHAALEQDVMNYLDNASTISPLSTRIKQREDDLQWSVDWCKKNGKNPDEDEDIIRLKEQIAKLEDIEYRSIYIDMERGGAEVAVTDLLDILYSMGLVESYEAEY